MIRRILTSLAITLSIAGFSQDPNTWTKLGDFAGLKRTRAVGIAIGDYGYVGTGVDTAEHTFKDWWQYDPTMDSWTQMEDVPGTKRRSAVAFVIDDFGYVGAGIDSAISDYGIKHVDFHKYDPGTNTWTTVAPYPGGLGTGVYQAAAFATNGKGYVACGKVGPDNYITDLWEYNPGTNSWTERPSFPGGDRHQLSAFAVEGNGYVGMGTDHDLYRKDWWKFDPVSLSWSAAEDLPGTERASASTFVIQSRAYVVFGSDGGVLDELWEYNPFADSWALRNNFSGSERKNGVAFAIGDTAYAGLGQGYSGKKASWYKYYPVGPLDLDETQSTNVTVYPNPAKTTTLISLPHAIQQGTYVICNYSGKIVHSESFSSNNIHLNVESFFSGAYLVYITNERGEFLTSTKLLVE